MASWSGFYLIIRPSEASSSCSKCSPGRISQGSGNSVCEECPAGKYEISRQWCNDCPSGSLSSSGSNACTKCQGGFFAAVQGSSMCDPCPSGTYAEEGSSKCVVCPPGTISGGGSGNCSHCAAGYFAKDSVACEACRGGTFSLGGSCRNCPPGHVSGPASAICSSCHSLLIRSTPDPTKQTCQISGLEVVLVGICWMTSAGFCFLFCIGFCGEVPIADISETQGRRVVTTTIAHQFIKSKGREVTFHNTRVPDLEKRPWKVSALSSFQLILHVDPEMENPLDTSMGTLRLKFPRGFLATGFFRCPTICWCFLSLAATVVIMSQLTWSLTALLCGLGILSGIAAFACRWRQGQLGNMMQLVFQSFVVDDMHFSRLLESFTHRRCHPGSLFLLLLVMVGRCQIDLQEPHGFTTIICAGFTQLQLFRTHKLQERCNLQSLRQPEISQTQQFAKNGSTSTSSGTL